MKTVLFLCALLFGSAAIAAPPPETSFEVSLDAAQIENVSIVCQIDNDVDPAPVANLDSIDSIGTSTSSEPSAPPLIDLRDASPTDGTFDSVRFVLAEPPQVFPLPPLIDLRNLRDVPSTKGKVTIPGLAELCTFTC